MQDGGRAIGNFFENSFFENSLIEDSFPENSFFEDSFIEKFQVPDAARPFISQMFTKDEIVFVVHMEKETFTQEDVAGIVGNDTADDFTRSSYRRGIISIADASAGTYTISNFYSRLDIFVVSEQETYRRFPEEARLALDAWYFDAYYDSLTTDPATRPTQDEILPLKQVLEYIDAQDRPVYLNYCDCRSLRGDCGKPTRTCITYRSGINTFAHRGISEKIDKEKAKEVVKHADKKGLMHTVNPNGICNCCGDCCYLFRSQARRASSGFWPKTQQIVEYDPQDCNQCGACTKRCYFGVFTKDAGKITTDVSKCVGCGICVNACPRKSLTLKERDQVELPILQQ